MATLLGYSVGLFLLVPLADLLENRKLIVRMLGCAAVSAIAAAFAPSAALLLVILFILGAACSAIHILVPVAASMVPPEQRGRVIGDVMGGLMIGIVLSRPLASIITDAFGWRAFYGVSAFALAILTLTLAARLPKRQPVASSNYPTLIASLWHLLRTEPVLRRRALTASLTMAAFSLFWTAVALRLMQSPFEFDQSEIALFALVGAAGAAATPLVGRAGDLGWTRSGTIASHLLMVGAFGLTGWAGSSHVTTPLLSLLLMGVGAVLLDIGVVGDHNLGRRAINLLRPEALGRLNGLFVGLFFLGGAIGAAAAGIAWTAGGWIAVCLIGVACGIAALLVDWIGGIT
ncbi:Predicted arabinose efflux permease, MFS family [Nitrosovibrio tenuis]|uniref:Predicted arabinose efflux permease, MFS family n=2 Tax=Nitrosovibrio tenuis TaxID=1233 RepID=A0A1H7RVT4_9PROT|nr:Predicted arabinose efflux permease, MFS family [Nitrosovibrio tenuis]